MMWMIVFSISVKSSLSFFLQCLPNQFTRLNNLVQLFLNRNLFKEIPLQIASLWRLQVLGLNGN